MLELYHKDAKIWLSDNAQIWVPGQILVDYTDNGTLLCQTDEGKKLSLLIRSPNDLPPLRNPEKISNMENLSEISYLNEPAVLYCLTKRFLSSQIYTYCGIILVAINPYQVIPNFYEKSTILLYRGRSLGQLDPHIFAFAEDALSNIEREGKDQSIIVSGESGAGKTISAKHVLHYFTTIGGADLDSTKEVQNTVVASSPLMEAVGNAKTTRNDNSSRFGKFLTIQFNKKYQIMGASIQTYLLEKGRVVTQALSERNYHIFYQMCAARSKPELAGLDLFDPSEFAYLCPGSSDSLTIPDVDDLQSYEETVKAMATIGFSQDDRRNIFTVLSAILQIGNLNVTETEDGHSCVNHDDSFLVSLQRILDLPLDIRESLTNRTIRMVNDEIKTPLTVEEAKSNRDALAKLMYSRLFDWIVKKVNSASTYSAGKPHRIIGVLDIYGFETFVVNSFEQLCINYANEKLQQHFCLHTFKLDQEEYTREMIDWSNIEFSDNQPCIDLIEKTILKILDDQSNVTHGTDASFTTNLNQTCKDSAFFVQSNRFDIRFCVKHFAGKVEYTSETFVEKNRDNIQEDQLALFQKSGNRFVRSLLETVSSDDKPTSSKSAASRRRTKPTVGKLFMESLNNLMSTLNSTTPHYVRCIKPNDAKMPFHLDSKRTVEQLRACGVIETIRISAIGYPSRATYPSFMEKFQPLFKTSELTLEPKDACQKMMARLEMVRDSQFGQTKIFLRSGVSSILDKLHSDRLREAAFIIRCCLLRRIFLRKKRAILTIQRTIRGFLARRKVKKIREYRAAVFLQRFVKRWLNQTRFKKMKKSSGLIQRYFRGKQARLRHQELLKNKKIVIIQSNVKGWLQRKKFASAYDKIRLSQRVVRQFLARRKLQMLKEESIPHQLAEHTAALSRGLENKIISLTQHLEVKKSEAEELSQKVTQLSEDKEGLEKQKSYLEVELQTANKALSSSRREYEQQVEEVHKMIRDHQARYAAESVQWAIQLDMEKVEKVESQVALKASEEKCRVLADQLDLEKDSSKKLKEQLDQEFESKLAAAELVWQTKLERERAQYEFKIERLQECRSSNDSSLDDLVSPNDSGITSPTASKRLQRSRSLSSLSAEPEAEMSEAELRQMIISSKRMLDKLLLERQCRKSERDLLFYQTDGAASMRKLEDDLKHSNMEMKKLGEIIVKDHEAFKSNYGAESYLDNLQNRSHSLVQVCLKSIEDDFKGARREKARLAADGSGDPGDDEDNGKPDDDGDDDLFDRYRDILDLDELLTRQTRGAGVQVTPEIEAFEAAEEEPSFAMLDTAYQKLAVDYNNLVHEYKEKSLAWENHIRERLASVEEAFNDPTTTTRDLCRHFAYLVTISMMLFKFDARRSLKKSVAPVSTTPVETGSYFTKKRSGVSLFGAARYQPEDLQNILRLLVVQLSPTLAKSMMPGLPACLIFMMIRWHDLCMDASGLAQLVESIVKTLETLTRVNYVDDDLYQKMALVVSNIDFLLNLLAQDSGTDAKHKLDNHEKYSIKNFDLGSPTSKDWIIIYNTMNFKLLPEDLWAHLRTFKFCSILNFLRKRLIDLLIGRAIKDLNQVLITAVFDSSCDLFPVVIRILTHLNTCLMDHSANPRIIFQVFRRCLDFIGSTILKVLLFKQNSLNRSSGVMIAKKLDALEAWITNKLDSTLRPEDLDNLRNNLKPLRQATDLLKARKSTLKHAALIPTMCSALSVNQILTILKSFAPKDEFEDDVSPDFLKAVESQLSKHPEKFEQNFLLIIEEESNSDEFEVVPTTIELNRIVIPEDFYQLSQILTVY